jgi:hypothetical protein
MVVACVVRSNGRIKDYFVTREYNVNEAYDGMPMLGRFIFSRDRNGTLVMVAMAEEAAAMSKSTRRSSLIEILYIGCRSSDSQKRLGSCCFIILSRVGEEVHASESRRG